MKGLIVDSKQKPSCQAKKVVITEKDLPLSCPTHDMELWNAHPRVYLPIEETHSEACPYCGTQFVLDTAK